jgi:hypothetical protein
MKLKIKPARFVAIVNEESFHSKYLVYLALEDGGSIGVL